MEGNPRLLAKPGGDLVIAVFSRQAKSSTRRSIVSRSHYNVPRSPVRLANGSDPHFVVAGGSRRSILAHEG